MLDVDLDVELDLYVDTVVVNLLERTPSCGNGASYRLDKQLSLQDAPAKLQVRQEINPNLNV